jgi:4-amino-4-deoxy-L-arabinose transferase-like glycosyltransferase
MKIFKKHFWLILIFVIGIFFRFINLNWDNNQHLHPDERFLTMVTLGIKWPSGISQYFDTLSSPLNPHNGGYPFYVYGTFPLFLIKSVSQLLGLATYDGVTLVGRFISAFFDSLIILLVYFISTNLFKSQKIAVFSALAYAVSVLPVQLAHYYAVDTYLTFFIVLSFYLFILLVDAKVRSRQILYSVLLGVVYGLALASKISAALFLPVLFLGFIGYFLKTRNLSRTVLLGLIFGFSGFISLRIFQPYMFIGMFRPNPEFINNLKLLKTYDDPSGWYPPGVQWITAKPLIFPLLNLFYWGLGPVLGIISAASLVLGLKRLRQYPVLILIITWIIGLFIYQGLQFAKPMRYFYPIYPFMALLAGLTLSKIWSLNKNLFLKVIFVLLLVYWPVSFISIYHTVNTRVQATGWILKNIPPGSTLSCEYWDDCLPLSNSGIYNTVEFHLYDPESSQKWQQIGKNLSQVDYIILSSNRLYGSIMTVPDKYPQTILFYRDLFSGKLGFIPVAQFASRPNLPLPGVKLCLTPPFLNYGQISSAIQACDQQGLSFVDDYSDESLTVYDHPKVIIFKKVQPQIP